MSETIAFKPESLEQVHKIIARYPEGRQKSALIPVLHIAQKEFGGWLAVPVMDYVAELLNITPIEVYEVATFYTMFNMKPVGKYVLEVCRTGPCMLNGSDSILSHIEKKLGIKAGQATPDKKFFIKVEEECLAACCNAPMMQVNHVYHTDLTAEKVDSILDGLE